MSDHQEYLKTLDLQTLEGYTNWVRTYDGYDTGKCAYLRFPSTRGVQCKNQPVSTICGYGFCKQHAQMIKDQVGL